MQYLYLFYTIILFFVTAFIVDLLIIKSSLRLYFIDIPDERKIHQIQIPRVGGIGILLSFFLVLALLASLKTEVATQFFTTSFGLATLSGMGIVFLVGFFDDLSKVSVSVLMKFGAQFLFAFCAVFLFGISVTHLNIFGGVYSLGYMGPLISIIWIVGVMNAFNIIDGIDGLSASITLITISVATVILFMLGDYAIIYITLPIMASILGFLLLNYPPAKIFAGDTGSLFFGSFVALLSLKIGMYANRGVESLIVPYIVAIPVLEVFVSMCRRFYYGMAENRGILASFRCMVQPDNLHMHHRLIYKGFNHTQALRYLVFFSLAVSLISIVLLLSDSIVLKGLTILYSFIFISRVFMKLEYAQSIIGYSKKEVVNIHKNITFISSSDYFSNALKNYVNGTQYFLKEVQSCKALPLKSDVLIIYTTEDIHTLYKQIPSTLTIPLFIISNTLSIKEFNNDKRVFIVSEPVDVPYLLHDIELVLKKGLSTKLEKTLSVVSKNND